MFHIFFFMNHVLAISRKSMPNSKPQDLLSLFYGFPFKLLICFKLMFLYSTRYGTMFFLFLFLFFGYGCPVVLEKLVESTTFFPLSAYATL